MSILREQEMERTLIRFPQSLNPNQLLSKSTNMNKITVIHHSADFDGLFCREIARKFLPDATLIGWDYKDQKIPFPNEGFVYVLDLSPECFENLDSTLLSEISERLIWIDHHKSAIEKWPTPLRGYRIDSVAACRLAWQWFATLQKNVGVADGSLKSETATSILPDKLAYVERRVTEPMAVRLAGEYDIWDKRDPRAELFQHGLRSQALTELTWKLLLIDDGSADSVVDSLLHNGKVLQYARAKEYEQVITEQGFDVEFDGIKFLACCSHECDIRSHLFEAGIKPHHEGLFGFTYTGKDWRVSLYGVPGKPDVDLSVIAVKHGGGGHKQACGFKAATLPFIK